MPTYKHARPCVTVDAVLFCWRYPSSASRNSSPLSVLMVRRGGQPYKHCLALPGGFVRMNESLDDAVRRELREETSLDVDYLEQLYTFGEPKRDPRARVITVAYCALAKTLPEGIKAGSDAEKAMVLDVNDVMGMDLAFDHKLIIATALDRLRTKIRYKPIGFHLIPEPFTLALLQTLYSDILGKPLDTRNFRRKIMSLGILKPAGKSTSMSRTGGLVTTHCGRPAEWYSFDRQAYEAKEKEGFLFEL